MADYLALLRDLSALHPPLFVFGSVAEAALLDGKLAAAHGDLDVLIPRTIMNCAYGNSAILGLPPSPCTTSRDLGYRSCTEALGKGS